jgi:hypothetical protein
MVVTDTKPTYKICSKCEQTKEHDKFIPNRNICKLCRNENCRKKYNSTIIVPDSTKECSECETTKPISDFYEKKKSNICKNCNNEKRRAKYVDDDELRKKLIKSASDYKKNKIIERQQLKEDTIGKDNKQCKYCDEIKHNTAFRYNRLKCRTCERDEPLDKFKRSIRSRIYLSLAKNKHTIEYLGCSATEYLKWILTNNDGYTLENRGSIWHIDHVIPLSKFNLDDEEEQLIAFNWRNTMPLDAKENLSKNNKIIKSQIEQHVKKLQEYHKENKIKMPQKYIELFARHLVAGSSLEPSLPLTDFGNICEEHG